MQGKTTSAEIIIEQNEFDDRVLLAPNGRDSLLSPSHWHLVRTPEFIEWFGDWMVNPEKSSKVLDQNGEPLVVFHGSNRTFDVFEHGHTQNTQTGYSINDQAFFFTDSYQQALAYANEPKNNLLLCIRNAWSQMQDCLEGLEQVERNIAKVTLWNKLASAIVAQEYQIEDNWCMRINLTYNGQDVVLNLDKTEIEQIFGRNQSESELSVFGKSGLLAPALSLWAPKVYKCFLNVRKPAYEKTDTRFDGCFADLLTSENSDGAIISVNIGGSFPEQNMFGIKSSRNVHIAEIDTKIDS